MARLAVLSGLALLTACAPRDVPTGINDPYEARNRSVHEFNIDRDRATLRPVAMAYGHAVPEPVRNGVGNFASNLSLPGAVVNSLLQLRPGDAAQNATRFLINSTIGLAGLFDPASPMGATKVATDFGETLHVWGVGEGAYVELPLIGPSTERDTLGKLVDIALNPLGSVLSSDERTASLAVGVMARVGDRYTYSDIVDSLLYESADSYAQARMTYLQNRRYQLGRGAEPEYYDPYEDPYAQ